MQGPDPDPFAIDDGVEALTGVDAERVAVERRIAELGPVAVAMASSIATSVGLTPSDKGG